MNKRKIGDWYEKKVVLFMKEKGLQIIERNFRTNLGEIDIIVKDGSYLVFVEVKYRKDLKLGMPEEAVGKSKQKKICRVAKNYLYKKGICIDCPIRFDVVAILESDIRWYKDAFPYQ